MTNRKMYRTISGSGRRPAGVIQSSEQTLRTSRKGTERLIQAKQRTASLMLLVFLSGFFAVATAQLPNPGLVIDSSNTEVVITGSIPKTIS